jgi:hypothetical protein
MVLTFMKRTLLTIPSHAIVRGQIIGILLLMQKEALSWPWHAMILLLHESMDRSVTAVEKIQYTVVSANIEVVMVKSHFRARLWSPLVLFHHKEI